MHHSGGQFDTNSNHENLSVYIIICKTRTYYVNMAKHVKPSLRCQRDANGSTGVQGKMPTRGHTGTVRTSPTTSTEVSGRRFRVWTWCRGGSRFYPFTDAATNHSNPRANEHDLSFRSTGHSHRAPATTQQQAPHNRHTPGTPSNHGWTSEYPSLSMYAYQREHKVT